MRTALLTGLLTAGLGATLHAQSVLPFPLEPRGESPLGGLALETRGERIDALAGLGAVRLSGVPLPGGRTVELELERLPLPGSDGELWIDGVEHEGGFLPTDLSLWKGRVAGVEGSEVYLAFSRLGSRGWIRDEADLVHLLAEPGPDGDWTRSRAQLWTEETLNRLGSRLESFCEADTSPRSGLVPKPTAPGQATPPVLGLGGPTPTLLCRVAFESDFQLYAQFGNLSAEQVYVQTLFGAIGDRYLTQVGTVMQIGYLALYSNPNDPWQSPDSGGSSIDMLNEFQAAWGGVHWPLYPGSSMLAHFLSGASLGGGVAYLDTLCNLDWGVGVSGNLGGDTPFPVVQHPANWDFMVVAHEIGHNFGTPHTHDYCPPLDQCPPPQYWGQCQGTTQCISTGTIMSYCHLCPGGVGNITTFFHPTAAATMRSDALASCLPEYCGDAVNYCVGAPNSTGQGATLRMQGTTYLQLNDLTLIGEHLPPNTIGIMMYGSAQQQTAFGNGFLCVTGPGGVFRIGSVQANAQGVMTKAVNFNQAPMSAGPGRILAGSTWNFQGWYRNPAGGGAGFNLTNGLQLSFCNF